MKKKKDLEQLNNFEKRAKHEDVKNYHKSIVSRECDIHVRMCNYVNGTKQIPSLNLHFNGPLVFKKIVAKDIQWEKKVFY